MLLFGLGAGVISELFNRRRLLTGVQAFQVCVGVGLAVLTASGAMTSALLLVATFLIGSANALQLPAYMALVPEIVPPPPHPGCRHVELDRGQHRPGARPGHRWHRDSTVGPATGSSTPTGSILLSWSRCSPSARGVST